VAGTKAPNSGSPRRRWPPAEKRRIVDLTMVAGASIPAIAREHGVHPNCLRSWKALYRAGKLDAQMNPASRAARPTTSATFFPVSVVPEVRRLQPAARPNSTACGSSIVQLVLTSGATLRIETAALDAALVCALVAELRR
jgi:transposase-like protein